MKGKLERVPFGTTVAIPEGTLSVQETYTRECGCRIIGGFLLNAATFPKLLAAGAGTADVDEIAREVYRIGPAACETHAAQGVGAEVNRRFEASLPGTSDRPVIEVAGEYLDEVLEGTS